MSYQPKLERHYVFKKLRGGVYTQEQDEAVVSLSDRAMFETQSVDNNDPAMPYGWCSMKLSFYPNVPTAEEEFRKKVLSLKRAGFRMEISNREEAQKVIDRITEAARKDMPECDYLIEHLAS